MYNSATGNGAQYYDLSDFDVVCPCVLYTLIAYTTVWIPAYIHVCILQQICIPQKQISFSPRCSATSEGFSTPFSQSTIPWHKQLGYASWRYTR